MACSNDLSSIVTPVSEFAIELSVSTGAATTGPMPFALQSNALVVMVAAGAVMDFEIRSSYSLVLTVCTPQSKQGFFVISSTPTKLGLSLSVCTQFDHVSQVVELDVTITDVNEPPVFRYPTVAFTAQATGIASGNIGFPLSTIVSDPDINNAAWSRVTFSMLSGTCSSPTSQLRSANATLFDSPFYVKADTGQLSYLPYSLPFSDVLSYWRNPLDLCVIATDGGGSFSGLDVAVLFTDVAASLSVVPTRSEVVHFSYGTSLTNVSVVYNAGSTAGTGWFVDVDSTATWLSVQARTTGLLALQVNSSALWQLGQQTSASSMVIIRTNGEAPR